MLPKISHQQNQEIVSRNRFRVLIPTNMFILRDEMEHDFGVDFGLEAIIDLENVSNFRLHMQLKSTHKYSENEDKTVSFGKISRSNINYLLNTPNSIYVVYFIEKDVFMWEWVNTIKDYALDKKIDLKSSPSSEFTYRFSKELDESSFKVIHQTVITFGLNLKDYFDDQSILDSFRNSLLLENFHVESDKLMKAYREKKYEEILLAFKDTQEFTLQEAVLFAICQYNLYRYNDGLLFVENILQKYHESIDLLKIKGCLLCESGIAEKSNIKVIMAKDLFFLLLNTEKSFENYYNLANAYSALNDNEQAILAYQKAVELNPDFAMAWKNLGTSYYYQKDFEQALHCYETALKYDPSLPEALFCKGSLFARNEGYEEALILYDKVIENKSFVKRCPSIFYWKAYVLFKKEKFDNALTEINLYILHKPADLNGMHLKARIYSKLWRQSNDYIAISKPYFESILVYFDNADWILIEIYFLCSMINNIDNAKGIFEKILQNHGVSLKISRIVFEQVWKDQHLISLIENIDFYIAFRKMSNIQDFEFTLLGSEVNSNEMFWFPHAIAFCKSMDDSEKMGKFNAKTLSRLFNSILKYVEESHLLIIRCLSEHYFSLNINKRASIVTSCIIDFPDIWVREATRIYCWICIRHEVLNKVSNKALDITINRFDPARCLDPYISEFNKVWKWSKDEIE